MDKRTIVIIDGEREFTDKCRCGNECKELTDTIRRLIEIVEEFKLDQAITTITCCCNEQVKCKIDVMKGNHEGFII